MYAGCAAALPLCSRPSARPPPSPSALAPGRVAVRGCSCVAAGPGEGWARVPPCPSPPPRRVLHPPPPKTFPRPPPRPSPPPAQSQRRSSTRLAHRRADQVSQGRGRGGGGSEPSASRPRHLGPARGLAQRGVRDAAMRDRGQGPSTRADDLPMGGGLCLTDGRWRAFTRRCGTSAGLELVDYLHDAPSGHAASVHVPRTSRDQTCLSKKEFGLVRD